MFWQVTYQDFDVVTPFRIHNQVTPDACTAAALASIAEDVLAVKVYEEFIYRNSSDGKVGITPQQAISGIIAHGVLTELGLFRVFTDARKIWGWTNLFAAIQKAMKDYNRPVFCGCYWQNGWSDAPKGILSLPSKWQKIAPHAFKVFGKVTIGGKEYLKIQNSRGTEKGDNGIWYAPQEVVNKFSFAYQLF